jgi:hypothetical protein
MFGDKVSREEFEILLNKVRHMEEWQRSFLNVYDTMSRRDFYAYIEKADEHNTLLAGAIGMEFKTEAATATPSKIVLVKKTEEDV